MKLKNFSIYIIILLFAQSVELQGQTTILINIKLQKLYLVSGNDTIKTYSVSTSKNGIGSYKGSYKTPLGKHKVISKFGDNLPIGSIFVAREYTGRTSIIYKDSTDIEDDFILTRILRLRGLETGKNLGGYVDSYERCIYIHGTNEEGLIGKPASHGCIRMYNDDVIELYAQVPVNTTVIIVEK